MHLSLDHISLSLAGKTILDDVSFSIRDGEFVSVLGESGAGKTTTLKIVAGLLPQDAGTVSFDGECVDEVAPHKRSCAIVFQDIRLFPNMNVLDNVAFSLKMQGMPRAERHARAEEMLEAVQLPGLGRRRTYELSGGQQQRVALARALAGKPRMMLLDEPFSGLDEQLREKMRQLVAELHERFGMTSLMVTHDPDEALTMSDRVIYISDGRVQQDGTPAELLLSPANEAVAGCFENTAAIEGRVESGLFRCGKLVVPAPAAADGPAVFVRVRGAGSFVRSL